LTVAGVAASSQGTRSRWRPQRRSGHIPRGLVDSRTLLVGRGKRTSDQTRTP
jgi:hypothetical protein